MFFLNTLIRNLFSSRCFFSSLFLLRIDISMSAVIHGFLAHLETLFFQNFICTAKFERVGCLSFTKQTSRLTLEFLGR